MPGNVLDYQAKRPPRRLARRTWLALVLACSIVPLNIVVAPIVPFPYVQATFDVTLIYALVVLAFAIYAAVTTARSQVFRGAWLAGAAIALTLVTGLMCPMLRKSMAPYPHGVRLVRMEADFHSLLQASCLYHQDHAAAPGDLADLFGTYGIQPKQLTAPDSSTTPLPPTWSPSSPTRAADLAAHSDIVFVGSDLPAFPPTPVVVLYTPARVVFYHFDSDDGCDGTQRIVGFSDGHVETVRDVDFPSVIVTTNAARAVLGLPPLSFPGMAPPTPAGTTTRGAL